jgi:D-alanine transaminase
MAVEMLYLNGGFLPLAEGRIGVEDRGFQLGDGVYEVIKVMNGHLVWPDDHLSRLKRSLGVIKLTEALTGHRLETVLPELVSRSGVEDGLVYLQITRGAAPREFVFPYSPHPTVLAYTRSRPPVEDAAILAGISLHPVDDLRWARCDIKSTNLLAAVLAKEEARGAGADEALFLGPDGFVREGGSSNVFAWVDGALRTHPADNRILNGITRIHVLELAGREGYPIEEKPFRVEEVFSAGESAEVFTASSILDLLPVVRVGSRKVGRGRPGPVTLRLLDLVRREQAELVGLDPPAALI